MAARLTRRSSLLLYSAAAASALLLLVNGLVILLIGDEYKRMFLSDLLFPVSNLTTTLILFYAARCSARRSSRLASAWLFLAIAQLVFSLADITWAVLEIGLNIQPFPSLADLFYLLYYPLLLVGINLIPEKPVSSLERLQRFLDILIILLASFMVMWNFLLSPLVTTGDDSFLAQALALAYPIGDLVLLWVLLRLLYSRPANQDHVPLFLLAAGAGIGVVFDNLYAYQALNGTYTSGSFSDLGWVVVYFLTSLAGIRQAASVLGLPLKGISTEFKFKGKAHPGLWTPYLPYIWLTFAYFLLLGSHEFGTALPFQWVAVGVGIIISLILVRQIITIYDNVQLSSRLKNEVEERKTAEALYKHEALHDPLTDLPNRTFFYGSLQKAINHQRSNGKHSSCVFFIDLDRFRVVNDSLGHAVGDQLLVEVAGRLEKCLQPIDLISRFGGDEFAVLIKDRSGAEAWEPIARSILDQIKAPFEIQDYQVFVSASIGVAPLSSEYRQAEEIIRDADTAMNRAKSLGKKRYEVFSLAMRAEAVQRQDFELKLRTAIERQEFQVVYQPVISISSGSISSFEALLRWRHPQQGQISPVVFIPLAEETGLILPIGKWVLTEACRQLHDWQQQFPHKSLKMNVNISGKQLADPSFPQQVEKILQKTGVRGSDLRLEITESVYLNNVEDVTIALEALTRLGIEIQIDDFGTGYSSLSYLQQFPLQAVKIDRSFVSRIDAPGNARGIIGTIIHLAHDLGMCAIAEGVETQAQLDLLTASGCDFFQGYLFAPPLPRPEAEARLAAEGVFPAAGLAPLMAETG